MIRTDENPNFEKIEQFIPYSFMQEIQRRSDIPAPFVIFSLIISSLMVSSGYLSQSLTNTITFVLPVYWTLKAVELRLKNEDKQWLTFWLIWAFFYVLDLPFSNIFRRIPNFYLFKLLFFIWLFLPSTMGAKFLYHNFFYTYSEKFDINYIINYLDKYRSRLTHYIKEKFGINLKDYENIEPKGREESFTVTPIDDQHESRQNIVSYEKINTDNLHTNKQNVKDECTHTIEHVRSKSGKEGFEEKFKPLKQEQLIDEGRFVAGHPVIEDPGCVVMKKKHDITIDKQEEIDSKMKGTNLENRTVL